MSFLELLSASPSIISIFLLIQLVYQPVPPHRLEIANNYNYLSHAPIHLLHILIIVTILSAYYSFDQKKIDMAADQQ
jgi:hypothetical protein